MLKAGTRTAEVVQRQVSVEMSLKWFSLQNLTQNCNALILVHQTRTLFHVNVQRQTFYKMNVRMIMYWWNINVQCGNIQQVMADKKKVKIYFYKFFKRTLYPIFFQDLTIVTNKILEPILDLHISCKSSS